MLYIDADEDHVALQDGRNVEPKLIYVHEGYVDDTEKRKKLRNVKYFTALQGNTEDLWLEVADYIDKKYNVEKIDKIYLSGDGAWWIKEGLNWIPKSKYVLDYFHLSKYVRVAIAQKPEYTMELWKNINKRDKKETMKLLSKIIKETEIETKKEAIKNVKKYITRNWEGIENRYEKEYIGCSAEGHISHIIADRMSSRPLGWCELGADQMVRLRVYIANGGKVSELLKRKEISKRKNKNDIKINYRSVNKKVQEQIDNIPSITQGKRTWEYRLMNSLRFA